MPADLKSIVKIEVPISVQIASRPMRVREVSSLAPGAIIELPKLADEELDVMIGRRRIGLGLAVKVGENFGIRITQVGTMRQRINAMAPAPGSGAPSSAPGNGDEAVDAGAGSDGEMRQAASDDAPDEAAATSAETDVESRA